MEYKIKIDAFEGPLDLLLHLIKTLEIDIYDIPVAEITDQYLDYIHQMRQLELDVASEFLVMAATLVAIKSRMLLPKPELPEDVADEAYEDPDASREELMRRLLEYRQFKEAAEALRANEQARMLVFAKPPSDLSRYEEKDKIVIPAEGRATVHDMLRAFGRVMVRKKIRDPLQTKIARQQLPIGQQMKTVISTLKKTGHPLWFDDLFLYPDRPHVVATFLALLELMKSKRIRCSQEANFSNILISLEDDVHEPDPSENTINY